jgi:TrmH family RNA methyltransferase
MISKAKIKLINSLKLSKYRKENKIFLAEGSTNVLDFLQSNIQVIEVFATTNWLEKHASILNKRTVTETNQKEFEKITALKTPSEVLALFAIPEYPQIDQASINDLVLMLDDIKDPGNLGTIIRTAEWFGIKRIICSPETVDAYNPKVVQASMGSLARVEVYYTDLLNFLSSVSSDIPIFGALLHGKPLTEIKKPEKGIILIGNEAHGISENLLPLITEKVTIPAYQVASDCRAESLNASIATAIICYAFRN